MNLDTGEIKEEKDLTKEEKKSERWMGIASCFKRGSTFMVDGILWEVLRVDFNPGKPGKASLKLKALGDGKGNKQ